MTHPAIATAIEYLERRGKTIPADVLSVLRNHYPLTIEAKGRLAASIKAREVPSRAMKQAGNYQPVRDELWASVYDGVWGYLSGNANIPTYKMPMVAAVSQAYLAAADLAYVEGGGSLPLDDDTASWVRAELDAQFGYIDSLFETLKQLRKEEDVDAIHEAFMHADRYSSALDGLYNAVKIAAAGNKMLTWVMGPTKEHCKDCQRLDGQRHRASWYRARGYFPRRPGSATECGGWNCACMLIDSNGNEFTI